MKGAKQGTLFLKLPPENLVEKSKIIDFLLDKFLEKDKLFFRHCFHSILPIHTTPSGKKWGR